MFTNLTVTQNVAFILGIVFSIISFSCCFFAYKWSKKFKSRVLACSITMVAPFIAIASWFFLIFSFVKGLKGDEVLNMFISLALSIVACFMILIVSSLLFRKNRARLLELDKQAEEKERTEKAKVLAMAMLESKRIEEERKAKQLAEEEARLTEEALVEQAEESEEETEVESEESDEEVDEDIESEEEEIIAADEFEEEEEESAPEGIEEEVDENIIEQDETSEEYEEETEEAFEEEEVVESEEEVDEETFSDEEVETEEFDEEVVEEDEKTSEDDDEE